MTANEPPVRAAGCVLWRRGRAGNLEIAVIHRPKYGDWSHPKGKLKRGEDALRAAVREVREETGMECEPGAELPTASYVAAGRPKEVRYWAARATWGTFVPGKEVDRMAWLPPAEAKERLTEERDRELVDALLAMISPLGQRGPH
ncbi:NUDIX hydrolase [Streptomyces abikoensis]